METEELKDVALGNISDGVSYPAAPSWALIPISAIALLAIVANFLILCVFISETRVRTVFNFYLLNLAFSDFAVGALGTTYYAVYTYYGHWPLGYRQCTAWIYFDFVGTSETLMTLMIIAGDRLWAITWPVSYKSHHTLSKCFLVIVLSWIVCHLAIVPGLTYYRLFLSVYQQPEECYWDIGVKPLWASSYFLTVFTEWIPIGVTVFCYSLTSWKIWKKYSRKAKKAVLKDLSIPRASIEGTRSESRYTRRERQAFFLLTLLFAALIVFWGPWVIYQIVALWTGFHDITLHAFCYWMAYSLSAVNPFLFNIGSPEMRRGLRGIFCSRQRPNFPRDSISRDQLELLSQKTLSADGAAISLGHPGGGIVAVTLQEPDKKEYRGS